MSQTSVNIVKAQIKDHDGCVSCIVTECKSNDKLVVKSAATYSQVVVPLNPNNLSDIDKK